MSVNLSGSSPSPPVYYCFDSRAAVSMFNSFMVAKLLFCGPLSLRVLHLGYQKWRWRSGRTATSDIFTFHMAALELGSLSMVIFYFLFFYAGFPLMTTVSIYIFSMSFPGEISFHCLTSVERYLAVVHPIFYRGLSRSGGVLVRNISTACAWMLCFEWLHVKTIYSLHFPAAPFFSFLACSLLIVSFCSLSVLRALIRPGPGDGKRVDQLKRRAFHTVTAILAVQWVWFLGLLVCFALEASPLLSYDDGCVTMMCGIWCCVPSSLVLPLLFLHGTERCVDGGKQEQS